MNEQLSNLIAQLKERRAQTFQEKIKSLDLRDDIWRKYIEINRSSSDAILAQRTGLCQDMCCERERLEREFQRLYKSYETDLDTRLINHGLMVTEYSRSSADQAMPSPYDLRPGPVLLYTMNYLITNIMERFDQDGEKSEWYNFLWDRLRAIRKEIRQQDLRDEIAIEILEQSARFHIFCSAFLSEYSRDSFDPNLNTKMLVDCLDQLRDCYLIQKKQNNINALKNLPEFTSYMLLLNLTEDNETLLRIRHLIEDITETKEISITFDIHHSFLLFNTTKFFFLVSNQATLLQSCLLNRYFNTIRKKRLNSLIKSTRNPNDEFRLSDLTDILGMDDDNEMRDYLEQLGYSISNTNPPCLLIPNNNSQIDQMPIIKLSQKLIRSKYSGNLKDIITGRVNTPVIYPNRNIENSFDSQGYFIGKIPFDCDRIVTGPSQFAKESSSTITNPIVPIVRMSTPIVPIQNPSQPPSLFGQRPVIRSFNPQPSIPTTTQSIRLNESIFPRPEPNTIPSIFRTSVPPPQSINPSSPSPEVLGSSSTNTETPPRTPFPVLDPPPQPVIRRLSMNSMDNFTDELYQKLIDTFIHETVYNIYDEFILKWNNLTYETVQIFNKLVDSEIYSIANECYRSIEYHEKLLNDTLKERYERERIKYLRKKYFIIWFENFVQAKQERYILNEIQIKYHFLTNEQLLEFLTGLQLLIDHDLTIAQTTTIIKSRRRLKEKRLKKISILSNLIFDEYLNDEFYSIVNESNDEMNLRNNLLFNALKKQNDYKRQHYIQMKYFSIWTRKYRQQKQIQRDKILFNKNNKRINQFIQLRQNKKLKDDKHQQYNKLKHSFEQMSNDLSQIQLFIEKLD